MSMKLKSIFSVFLSLALVIGLMPGMSLTAYAANSVLYVGNTQVNPCDNAQGDGWSTSIHAKTDAGT